MLEARPEYWCAVLAPRLRHSDGDTVFFTS